MHTNTTLPGKHLYILLAVLVACGPTPKPQTGPPKKPAEATPKTKLVMEPIRLQVKGAPEGVEPSVEVFDAGTLFERGGQLLSAKKYADAVTTYNRLLETFPGSRYVSPALYNAGLCHEWRGEFDKAALRYKELIRRFGHTKEAVDAGFRLGGCYAELQNWAASAQVFQILLSRKDLSASDRIECYARKGLAHFRMGDHRACKSTLEAAIKYNKNIEVVERLDSDFFLAMAHYYIAAIPHVEFRKQELKSKAKSTQLARTLDDKARLLILSQAGYIKTIKVKNPYWASASGFQIGSLYREFYSALLTALPDFTKQAKRNARLAKVSVEEARKQLVQVYMEEVHKAVKPLLNKAIRVFEKNVEMAERVGVRSNWVAKSRRQIQDLKHLLSVSPKEAVELVREEKQVPEDQPALKKEPGQQTPSTQPTTPTVPQPPKEPPDEPGRVIL
jgi:tetratricopeptide (TPR) repeat protein